MCKLIGLLYKFLVKYRRDGENETEEQDEAEKIGVPLLENIAETIGTVLFIYPL